MLEALRYDFLLHTLQIFSYLVTGLIKSQMELIV